MNEQQQTPVYSYTYYTPYYPPKPPLRAAGTKRDLIFAAMLFLLSLLCVNFCLWGGLGIGASIMSVILYFTGICYVFPKRTRCSGYALACMVLYVLCAFTLSLSDSSFGKYCALFAMTLLAATTLMELLPLRKRPAGSLAAISDWCSTAFVLSFGSFGAACYALFHRENAEGAVQQRSFRSILIGIVCAIPALLVIIPLLSSADGAFLALFRKLSLGGSSEAFFTLILGGSVFLLLFGQHFAARHAEAETPLPSQNKGRVDPTVMLSFLCTVCAVYVLYLVSQLAYFFSAFAGLLPEDFSVAQYARRGFFEMCLICVINLALVMVVLLTVRKSEGKEPLSIRLLSLFLCVFSVLLIVTAMSKMVLYIDRYGMTHLRIITSTFMIFLFVLFCTVAFRLFFRRLPYMKIALLTGALLIALMGFADLDRLIAGYNVNAYLSGELESVDMSELAYIESESAVPYIWELTKDENPNVSERAYDILYTKLSAAGMLRFNGQGELYFSNVSYDWRAYNLPDYKAFCLLQKHGEEIIAHAAPSREDR